MARYASGNDAIAGEFMAAVMPELDDWLFDKDTAKAEVKDWEQRGERGKSIELTVAPMDEVLERLGYNNDDGEFGFSMDDDFWDDESLEAYLAYARKWARERNAEAQKAFREMMGERE